MSTDEYDRQMKKMLDELGIENIADLKPTKVGEDKAFYWEKWYHEIDTEPVCPLLTSGREEFIKCIRGWCAFWSENDQRCRFGEKI